MHNSHSSFGLTAQRRAVSVIHRAKNESGVLAMQRSTKNAEVSLCFATAVWRDASRERAELRNERMSPGNRKGVFSSHGAVAIDNAAPEIRMLTKPADLSCRQAFVGNDAEGSQDRDQPRRRDRNSPYRRASNALRGATCRNCGNLVRGFKKLSEPIYMRSVVSGELKDNLSGDDAAIGHEQSDPVSGFRRDNIEGVVVDGVPTIELLGIGDSGTGSMLTLLGAKRPCMNPFGVSDNDTGSGDLFTTNNSPHGAIRNAKACSDFSIALAGNVCADDGLPLGVGQDGARHTLAGIGHGQYVDGHLTAVNWRPY